MMSRIRTYGTGGLFLPSLIRPRTNGITGTHAYWRLATVGSDDQGGLGFSGLELASTPGGADFAPTATAITASHALPSQDVSFLIDNNPTSFWEADVNVKGRWVKLQFSSPQTVAEVRIIPRTPSYFWQTPTVFFIAGSDDDVTWYTYAICIASTWTTSTQSFAVGSTPLGTGKSNARVWGLDITANNSGFSNTAFAELIFASSIGGATLCTGGRHFQDNSVSLTSPTEGPSNLLFDGNPGTIWNSGGGVPRWVGYAWATPPSTPVQMRLQARSNFLGDTPRDFNIQWTDDGITYHTTDAITGETGWTANEVRGYTIT